MRMGVLLATALVDGYEAVAADPLGGAVTVGPLQSATVPTSTGWTVERVPGQGGGFGWVWRPTPLAANLNDTATAVAVRGRVVAVAGSKWSNATTGYDATLMVWIY